MPSGSAETAPVPRGMRAAEFRFRGEDLAVLSLPLLDLALPPSLSEAECDIAQHLLAGRSNQAIAVARGTSTRTVANQVSALFRKLHVGSRGEFLVTLARLQPS